MCLSIPLILYAHFHIWSKMTRTHPAPEVVNDFNYEAQSSTANRYNHLVPRTAIIGSQIIVMGLVVAAFWTHDDTFERVLGGKRAYTINFFGFESLLSAVAWPMALFACHREARQHILSLLGKVDPNTVIPMEQIGIGG